MISKTWGAVCLLRNSAGTGLDTYRMTEDDWEDIEGAGVTTGSGYVTALKAEHGGLQDTGAGAVLWMDAFYCTDKGGNVFQCTAYQPDWYEK